MKGSQIFRFVCIALLWLALCYIILVSRPFTLWIGFVIVASGIVVFVPLYKKYVKQKGNDASDSEK